jgi:hypothetical protein
MKVLKYIALLWLGALLTGCLKDANLGKTGSDADDGFVTVEFTASQHADSQNVTATRALTDDQENRLETVDVLVFETPNSMPSSHKFLFATHGFDITNTSGSQDKTFKAMLRTTDGSGATLTGRKIRMIVLGNMRDEWNAIKGSVVAGTTTAGTVYSNLLFDATGAWNTTTDKRYLPMAAETSEVQILKNSVTEALGLYTTAATPAAYASPIQLKRAVASIDVGFGYGEGTTAQGLDNFKLKNVYVYNTPENGFGSNRQSFNYTSDPNPPVEMQYQDVQYALATPSDKGMFNTIYTPETSPHDDTYLYLVIGGYYTAPDAESENTTELSWYKIDKLEGGAGSPQNCLRRNYKYTVQVEAIYGPGFATAEEAAESDDTELLNLNIIPWDMSESSTTVGFEAGDDYYFLVSPLVLELSADERTDASLGDNTLALDTDYEGGWTVDEITYASPDATGWLGTDAITGAAGQTELVITTTGNDQAYAITRTGYIHLSAGRWKHVIEVTQAYSPTPLSGVLAAPGVIGYIKGTNTLTLRGSKEYADANLDANGNNVNDFVEYAKTIHPDGLSDQTVYVAYFKFGSLVALSSDSSDSTAPYIEPDDIIATPTMTDGYIGIDALKANVAAETTDTDRMNQIPTQSSLASSATIATNLTAGIGDACDYYFADGDGTATTGNSWHLPTGNPYDGYSSSDLTWKPAGASGLGEGLPAGMLSTRSAETGIFYNVTGWRLDNGRLSVYDQNEHGSYWSSTAKSGTDGYNLYFANTKDGADPSCGQGLYVYGFGVRCVLPPAPTISVSPTSHTFAAAGGTQTFAVTTTNTTEMPQISTSDSWFSWGFDGTTLTVEAGANPSGTEPRSGSITFSLTSGQTATVFVSQDALVPGVRAVPGVIGYFATGPNKGELTLGGDGTDGQTVYVAHFKFGSLIAIDSPSDTSPFTSADIIAVPTGFQYTLNDYKAYVTGSGDTAWNMVNDAGDAGITLAAGDNITSWGDAYVYKGLGDPCAHYFNNEWRLPTTLENNYFVGGLATGTTNQTLWKDWAVGDTFYYYGTQGGQGVATWVGSYDFWNHGGATHLGDATDPNTGSFPVVANATDYPGVAAFSTVLPAAGSRSGQAYAGYYESGMMLGQGIYGDYWSSTANNNMYGYYLSFGNGYAYGSSYREYDFAFNARCVPAE